MEAGVCVFRSSVCLIMKPYGLSVSVRAASTGSCDTAKKRWDETWVAYSRLLLLSCLFSFLPAPPPSPCCLLPIPLFSLLLPSPFFLSPQMHFLFDFVCLPTSFSLLLPSSLVCFFQILLCLHPLVSPFPSRLFPLSSMLVPVVFASLSLSPNKINWCETILLHVFLWNPERRLWSDLNLHVRKRI